MTMLSRGSRPIGPVYNDTNREARKLKRQGFGRAADELALTASRQKLAGGGSNISSADSNRDERDTLERVQSGVMRGERDSILKPEAGGADPLSGTGASRPTLSRPTTNASLNEARPGETYSQVLERQRGSRQSASAAGGNATGNSVGPVDLRVPQDPRIGASNPSPTLSRPKSTLSAPTNAAEQAADDAFGTSYAKPTLSAPTNAAPAPPREGRINGMPASQAIAGVEKPAAFGANYATQNLEKLGLSGAIADYRRREAEAGKPAEPGNMAELKARDAGAPTTPAKGVVGPLQRALNESEARNAERKFMDAPRTFDWTDVPKSRAYISDADNAASNMRLNRREDAKVIPGYAAMQDMVSDSTVAGAIFDSNSRKITNGLNAAPTPNLTRGLAQPPSSQLGPTPVGRFLAAATAPAPVLSRPSSVPAGRLNVKLYGPEGYVDPKHTAKVAEMEKAKKAREEKNRINMGNGTTKQPAMDRLFGPKPSFLQGSLAGRYYDALNK